MSRSSRGLALAALGLLASLGAGCSKGKSSVKTSLLVTFEAEPGPPPLHHILLDVYRPGGAAIRGLTVPETGMLPAPTGTRLGTFVLTFPDGAAPGERRLYARGIAGGATVSQGTAKVTVVPGSQVAVTVTLGKDMLPDADGDGVPDPVDDCPMIANPDQGPCGDGGSEPPPVVPDAAREPGAETPIDGAADTVAPGDAPPDVPSADMPADIPTPVDAPVDMPVDTPVVVDAPDEPETVVDVGSEGDAPPMTCSGPGTCPGGGACVDGWCCNSACSGTCEACNLPGLEGQCTAIPDGMDPASECPGSGTCRGTCDGTRACRFPPPSTACGATTCMGGMVAGLLCDGAGMCKTGPPTACAPFVCDVMACKTACGGPTDCVASAFCDSNGVCRNKLANGGACASADACTSGTCIDGVCCATGCSGVCQACNVVGSIGTCAAVKSAEDDTCKGTSACDAAGACKKNNGETCPGGVADCASGFCIDGVCCDAACTAACRSCNQSGKVGTCSLVTSGTDSDTCTGSSVCGPSGACGKVDGTACGGAGECSSGFCKDTVCCHEACTTACRTCNGPGTAGTCTTVTSTDDAPECTGTGTCDGSGTCKRQNGQSCPGGNADCASGFCADGVCCNETCGAVCHSCNLPGMVGTCGVVLSADDVPECMIVATCDGSGMCKKQNGQSCPGGNSDCLSGVCADGVCCNVDCSGTCKACNLTSTVGTCTTVVSADDADTCTGANTCTAGGACLKKNGQTCPGGTGDCASGLCADGVCCDNACTGTCKACNLGGKVGTCSTVTNATDADTCTGSMSCNGSGACTKNNGASCSSAGECASGFCKDGACCNSACTTPCNSCATGTCTAVTSADDVPECTSTGTCNASGQCKRYNGQSCSTGSDCQSTFCADSVCCDNACTGTCRSCNLGGTVGTCTYYTSGTDPAGECGTGCTSSTCTASGGTCNGAGACTGGSTACTPYGCSGSSACKTTCSVNTDCCGSATRYCVKPVATITCSAGGTIVTGSTVTSDTTLNLASSCTATSGSSPKASYPGNEAAYKFVAATTQTVTFKLHWGVVGPPAVAGGQDTDLFVFSAEGACASGNCCSTISSCSVSAHATSDETVTLSAVSGQTYWVVADTYVSTGGIGNFTLTATCP